MNSHVGGPLQQVVLLRTGRSTRARMTRIGTVRRDIFVMRDSANNNEFVAQLDNHGVLREMSPADCFDEIEGLTKALATVQERKSAPYTQPEFTPHLDYKPADEDYVRPNFAADEKVFL